MKKDHYGRMIPKHAHGTYSFEEYTSSTKEILNGVSDLYDRIVNPELMVRRVNITANNIVRESDIIKEEKYEQLDLFTDYEKINAEKENKEKELAKEKRIQEAMLSIKKKYGKNSILKGMNFEEGATTIERNNQIGGHKA